MIPFLCIGGQVTLPSGDRACVHILEHFPRGTLDDHLERLEDQFGPRINPSPFKTLASSNSIFPTRDFADS
jgi:hypothetical protein